MELQRQQQDWGRQIVSFAARQGIRVRVRRAVRSSQVLAYCLEMYEPGQLKKLMSHDESMALALRTKQVRLGRTLGEVTAEITLPPALFTPLSLASMERGRGSDMPLGRSILNRPVHLDLSDDNTPHGLVAGTTGSGKSVLLQTMVTQLARQNTPAELGLLLIDGKHEALMPFADLAHLVHPIITEPAAAAAALAWAVAEMERRKGSRDWLRLVIVIDEIAEVIGPNGGANGPAAQCMQRLAAVGRGLGINLLLATQYPNAEVLGGALAKANLPARLAGHVTDANASTLATGHAGIAAHRLAGKGDFILVAGGDVQRLQVAKPAEADLRGLAHGRRSERLVDLGSATADGALAATNGMADPVQPEQVAWCLASGVPGIGTIKRELGIGSAKAGRVQAFARDLVDALAGHGCSVYCEEVENDG